MDELDPVRDLGRNTHAPADARNRAETRLHQVLGAEPAAGRRPHRGSLAATAGVAGMAVLTALWFIQSNRAPSGDDDDLVEIRATTVVQQPDEPFANVCLGVVTLQAPPQCSDLEIENWDWAKAPPSTTTSGTRHLRSAATLVGRLDGRRLTLTGPVQTRSRDQIVQRMQWPTVACAPELRWERRLDLRPGQLATVRTQPGVAGVWVVRQRSGGVVNVRLLPGARLDSRVVQLLRGISTCVTTGGRTSGELARIGRQLPALVAEAAASRTKQVVPMRMATAPTVQAAGAIALTVTYDDGSVQREADDRYGKGTVRVSSLITSLSPRATASRAFWAQTGVNGIVDWVQYPRSLSELRQSSDAVVRGRIVDVSSRNNQGIDEARLTIQVSHPIAGNLRANDRVEVNIMVRDGDSAGRMRNQLPVDDVVAFLKRAQNGQWTIATGYGGLWAATDRGSLDTPLAGSPLGTLDNPFVDVEGLSTLDALETAARLLA